VKSRSCCLLIGLVLGVSLGSLGVLGEDEKLVKAKKKPSSSMKLLLSSESPFSDELKALSELIVEPRDLDSWKHQGVISGIVPSLFGKRNKRLPKFFVINLFNPFAGKQYGYVDPLAPYNGPRAGEKGFIDVKSADMQGIPLIGTPW
jgi:hypothetical protein